MKKFALALVLLTSVSAFAQVPGLVNRQNGQYLGNLSANRYDPNSVNNPYGQHGSQYAPNSINNPYGRYGSRYSNDSVNNPYATNAPAIVVPPCYGC
jgi:hypothetical protein